MKKKQQFIKHERDLLESPVWRNLSLRARALLHPIELEHLRHGGQDNGKLPVTYDDFVTYGIGRNYIKSAIAECVKAGLLEITRKGRGGKCAEFRQPNLFRLTYLRAYDKEPTDEWRTVKTDFQSAGRTDFSPRAGLVPVPPADYVDPPFSVRGQDYYLSSHSSLSGGRAERATSESRATETGGLNLTHPSSAAQPSRLYG